MRLGVVLDHLGEIRETLDEALTVGGAAALNVPGPVLHVVHTHLVSNLGGGEGTRQVLLVGQDQEDSIVKLGGMKHVLKLLSGDVHSLHISAVNDVHEGITVVEVMPPQCADLVLAANIPHLEPQLANLNSFGIETTTEEDQKKW